MRIEDLLDRRSLRVGVDVPNLELAAKGANEEVVLINLVQAGGALLVFNLELNALATGLDVDINDQNLLVFEA